MLHKLRSRSARRASHRHGKLGHRIGRFEALETRIVLDGASLFDADAPSDESPSFWVAAFYDSVLPVVGPAGEDPPIGITNGRFDVSDSGAMNYGWSVTGDALVAGSRGTLVEDDQVFSGFSQTFRIPAGANSLRFSLLSRTLGATAAQPPDAFEVALLNATTFQSLVPVVAGLTNSDAFFNLQSSGELFFGPTTTVTDATVSGGTPARTFPVVVTVDLTAVPADTVATLYFDLLAFGAVDSEVTIDGVTIVGFDPPPLDVMLATGTNSGLPNDNITNVNPVMIVGTTDPLGLVRLDVDGDGFDDGQTIANSQGEFTLSNVSLNPGTNSLVVRAGTDPATTDKALTVVLDQQGPTSTLLSPTPGANLTSDQGYVEIRWSDTSGLDTTTFGINDVVITGVTVDRIISLPNNTVRYVYNDDDDLLPGGTVEVRRVAGQVLDLSGNQNSEAISSFNVALLVDAGKTNSAVFGNPISLVGARFRYPGNHNQLTATINWGDGNTTPVALPPGSGGGAIAASHTYLALGVFDVTLTIVDTTSLQVQDTTMLSIVRGDCGWQNPFNPLDVDFDMGIFPVDAILIINEINATGIRDLPNPPVPGNSPPPFYDTSCDNSLNPLDAALVINAINAGVGGSGGEPVEGEPAKTAAPVASELVLLSALQPVSHSLALAHRGPVAEQVPQVQEQIHSWALWQYLQQGAIPINFAAQFQFKPTQGSKPLDIDLFVSSKDFPFLP